MGLGINSLSSGVFQVPIEKKNNKWKLCSCPCKQFQLLGASQRFLILKFGAFSFLSPGIAAKGRGRSRMVLLGVWEGIFPSHGSLPRLGVGLAKGLGFPSLDSMGRTGLGWSCHPPCPTEFHRDKRIGMQLSPP